MDNGGNDDDDADNNRSIENLNIDDGVDGGGTIISNLK
jgi:hypothetical protein